MFDKQLKKLRQSLAVHGKKYSLEREEVLEIVLQLDGHFSLKDLCRVARESGRIGADSTIYRNINLLVNAGIVNVLRLPGGNVVYETNVESKQHAHCMCSGCGKIKPVVLSEENKEHFNKICDQNNYAPVSGSFIIRGYCSECNESLV